MNARSVYQVVICEPFTTYSLYAIAKEQNCRFEGLQRIEEGKDVTTTNLMHYLHFIKMHEPESPVIAEIWAVL